MREDFKKREIFCKCFQINIIKHFLKNETLRTIGELLEIRINVGY